MGDSLLNPDKEPETRRAHQALAVGCPPAVLETLGRELSRQENPWCVAVAAGARDALPALADAPRPFGLVLAYGAPPGPEALQVIALAQTVRPEAAVLVVSGERSEPSFLSALRAGATGYVLEDDDHLPLAAAIRAVLDGGSPLSPSIAGCLCGLPLSRLRMAPAGRPGLPAFLPPQELRLIALLAEGLSYKECAGWMGVSLSTIQTYVRRVYRRLSVRSRTAAILQARALGLL